MPAGVTLTAYTGPCTITTANTVIDSKTITCGGNLDIRASGVVIRRSHFIGGVSYAGITVLSGSLTIEDSWIENRVCRDCSVDAPGGTFTIRRTDISGSNRYVFCESTCRLEDNWLHDSGLSTNGDEHASAVRVQQNATLIHNSLHCSYTDPQGERGCSADMSGYPDFAPIRNNTMIRNLFRANNVGQYYCAYGGATGGKPYSNDPTNATNIVFRENIFERGPNGRCGTGWAITDFACNRTGNVWQNNRWNTGELVSITGPTNPGPTSCGV